MLRIYALIFLIAIIMPAFILKACPACNPLDVLYGFLVVSEPPQACDAIIVLGGKSERDKYAAELYNLGFSKKIIVSGVSPSAGYMTERAVKNGVRREDIIAEKKARSTYQNALFTREIMLDNGFRSAIVVSSPFHMRRSRMVFERVYKNTGISLTYCAAQSGFNIYSQREPEYTMRTVLMEYVKLFYYWARYW